ncbi:inositol monophosphatase [Patescibacteria group bacterium]|nr:inositol monophosphatase [Patescibacteria group bacterium]
MAKVISTNQKSKLAHGIDVAIEAALQAGKLLRDNYLVKNRFAVKDFSSDFVSEIDTQAEDLIIDIIKKSFQEHGIFGEESGKAEGNEHQWIIDPIDGTTHYLKQIPLLTVNIALQKDGQTLIGVVYNPMTEDLFYASLGDGAYWNQKRISVSNQGKLSESMLYVEFPEKKYKDQVANFEEFYQERINELTELLEKSAGVEHHRVGAWGICQVAKGSFDAYVDLSGSTKVYDAAAALLILEEAGGLVVDLEVRKEDSLRVLASNGKVKIPFLKAI